MTSNPSRSRRRRGAVIALLTLVMLAAAGVRTGHAGDSLGILSGDSAIVGKRIIQAGDRPKIDSGNNFLALQRGAQARAYGRTYGEWSKAWWTWALSLEDDGHPVLSEGEVDCSVGQRRKVWYLAGTAGGDPVLRNCNVKRGRSLLYPLINAVFINVAGDCDRPEGCTIDEKRGLLDFLFSTFACNLFSIVDGIPTVYGVTTARTQSPAFLAEVQNNIFVPEGTTDPEAISDGFWVLIPPLAEGDHTISFGGGLCDPATGEAFFETAVTYELTVQ